MNNKGKLVVSGIWLISILLIAAFALSQTAPANTPEKLLGSWRVAVTTPNQGTFPALLTFTADGSVITDESPAPFESSGHGNWVARGQREVAYTFVALFGSKEGKNTGKLKVVGTLQLGAGTSNWSGPFKIEGFDANGKVTFADRGTFTLTRIMVEPLD